VVDGKLLVCEFARAHALVAGSLKVLVAGASYGISTYLLCAFRNRANSHKSAFRKL
jgi:hypothetical protein